MSSSERRDTFASITPEHDQPDHEGLSPASKRDRGKKLRLQSGYCEYKMKALLIKVGSVTPLSGR